MNTAKMMPLPSSDTGMSSKSKSNDKESVLNYLQQCGIDHQQQSPSSSPSSSPFNLDDIDESSMALLLQLGKAQKSPSSTRVANKNDEKMEHGKTQNGNNSNNSNNSNNNNKSRESNILDRRDDNERSSSSSVLLQVDEENSMTDVTTKRSDDINKYVNANGEDSPVTTERVSVEPPTTAVKGFINENRDYEQILSQFSLDSKSFAKSPFSSLSSYNQIKHSALLPPPPTTTTTTTETATTTTPSSTVNSVELQLVIFHNLEKQYEHISKCQDQIQSLATLIAQDMVERRQLADMLRNNPQLVSTSATVTTAPPSSQGLLLSLLERFFANLFHFPRLFIAYIQSTRIVRVIKLIHQDALTFRQNGQLRENQFIHGALIMKIIFLCIFLHIRFDHYDDKMKRIITSHGGSSRKIKTELAALGFWKDQRVGLLVVAAIIVYFIRTGLWKLLYHIVVKNNVFRRVWRNEDLEHHEGSNEDGNGGGGDRQPRRGRRDRQPVHRDNGIVQGGGNGNDDEDNNGILHYIQNQTFMGGLIDRPIVRDNDNQPPNRQIPQEQILLEVVIESVKDVLYLFGSFFFSLFPMWHPRARDIEDMSGDDDGVVVVDDEREIENNDHEPAQEGQNNGDDMDDGDGEDTGVGGNEEGNNH
jgi:hypothetical protein